MAKEVIEIVRDDLDGKTEGAKTHTLMVDGDYFEIDLIERHVDLLNKALAKFIAAARPVDPPTAAQPAVAAQTRRTRTRTRSSGDSAARERTAATRAWLKANGHPDLGDRGRIPQDLQAKYDAAHTGKATAA